MGQTPIQKAVNAILKKHPDGAHRTLAKALHEKNPALFTSVENARTALRAATGNQGAQRRKLATQPRAPRKPGELPPLPKSEAKPWVPYVLEGKRILILGDIHLCFQDNEALGAALQYGQEFKPDAILLNGDVFDFHQISVFDKDPAVSKLQAELAAGKEFFTHLRKRFPKARILLRYGNHDRRWDLYLMRAAPLLWEALPSLHDIWHKDAGIPENNIEVVREKRIVMLGKLPVLHGDELPRGISNPVNASRGAFIKSFESVYVGHFHQQSTNPARTLTGKSIQCWSSGCLCTKNPQWLPINQWTSGFGTVEVEKDGNYHVRLHMIVDGKVF